MSDTYPPINGVKPELLKENDNVDVETLSQRAIYNFQNKYVTIKPDYSNISNPNELTTDRVNWVVLTGDDKMCTGGKIGPFASSDKAVSYIASNLE